jgi:hypothetical protein
MKKIVIALALFVMPLASGAQAATFTVATGMNSIVIYSAAKEPEICTVRVPFSYLKDGKRHKGQQLCTNTKVVPGEKQEFCKTVNDELVSVRVEGDPQVDCHTAK